MFFILKLTPCPLSFSAPAAEPSREPQVGSEASSRHSSAPASSRSASGRRRRHSRVRRFGSHVSSSPTVSRTIPRKRARGRPRKKTQGKGSPLIPRELVAVLCSFRTLKTQIFGIADPIWEEYDSTSESEIFQCKRCGDRLTASKGSTYGMRVHLESKHTRHAVEIDRESLRNWLVTAMITVLNIPISTFGHVLISMIFWLMGLGPMNAKIARRHSDAETRLVNKCFRIFSRYRV